MLQGGGGVRRQRKQILVSSHTNVAVDKILTGLVDSGFTGLGHLIAATSGGGGERE